MKLHRITYKTTSADHGAVISHQEFAASDGAASKCMTEIKKELKDTLVDKPERESIEIPTDKSGLIEWLNANAVVLGVVFE